MTGTDSPRAALATGILWVLLGLSAPASSSELLALRQEYNAVSAHIDSLTRMMADVDPKALDAGLLPKGDEAPVLPEGASVVVIFWADDEARVWINDYLVGETRLRPVEVTVPSLYLRSQNRIRARCWDTDWVESGFLCGLYLKDHAGGLHRILVSDGTWRAGDGSASEIAYAHPIPDIPGAEVIWGTALFGTVEMARTFDQRAIRLAASRPAEAMAPPSGVQEGRMDYHTFVQSLARLEERREALKSKLREGVRGAPPVPVYAGPERRSLSLTLGKAGPLRERVSVPVADRIKSWAQELPESQKHLIFPERRRLKGEGAANPAHRQPVPTEGETGARQRAYRPPDERPTVPPGSAAEGKGKGEPRDGAAGGEAGPGGGGGAAGTSGGWAGAGRASRLGLWLPTLLLGLYVGYVVLHWQELTGGERKYPWGD